MREPQDIKTVAVLGCGIVGFSWAVVFARHGRSVHLYNRPSPSLTSAKERVRTALEFLHEEGVIDASEAEASLASVRTFDDLAAAVTGADYVQEALPEDLALKQRILAEVAELTGPDVVIGSSCSGLMRADIVRRVKRHPERCIVVHPQPAAPDSLRGDCRRWRQRGRQGGRYALHGGGRPEAGALPEIYGYVLNRLQLALIQQALHLVREEICDVAAVERASARASACAGRSRDLYGVEELNSADLGEGLRKYRAYMLEGFRNLEIVDDYDEEFVQVSSPPSAP